jgi:hypothetical protein
MDPTPDVDFDELRRTFVPPSGLSMNGPRSVRLSAGGWAMLAVAVVLMAGAIVVTLLLEREAQARSQNHRALDERGAVVDGEVARLWPRGEKFKRVAYRFVVDGQVFEDEGRVSEATRRSLSVGSIIPVRYLPDRPDVNDLGQARRGIPIWLPPIIGVALFGLGVTFLFGIARQRRLLTIGRAAPAVVTATKKYHTSHGGTQHTVTYRYRALSGALQTSKGSAGKKPPAIGTVVCVVYDPDRPSRQRQYPFEFVKPA